MAPFDQSADRVAAAVWNLHPRRAVRLGVHAYDGEVPDFSPGARAAAVERLERLAGQLEPAAGLDDEQDLDRLILLGAIRAEIRAAAGPVDPFRYLEPMAAVDDLLSRDYAPAGLRVERAIGILERAPAILAPARADPSPLPVAVAERARRRASALAAWLGAGPVAVPPVPASEERWLQSAAAAAAREVAEFGDWLGGHPVAETGLPPGAREALLAEAERWEEPPAAWAARAGAALAADLEALAALPAAGGPGLRPGDLPAAVEQVLDLAGEAGLGAPAEREIHVVVGASPFGEPRRLHAPGPFDEPFPALLRVAPEVAAGRGLALEAAVAAAGSLAFAARLREAPTATRRRFPSAALRAGWGLHFGEALWEAGFRGADPAWRAAWLRRALGEDCRLAAAARLAGGDLSPAEVADAFVTAGFDEARARREAEEAAADPGCGRAALGRSVILDRRREGGGPAGFYRSLFAEGPLPLGLLGPRVGS